MRKRRGAARKRRGARRRLDALEAQAQAQSSPTPLAAEIAPPPVRLGLRGEFDAARSYGPGVLALAISLLLYFHSQLPYGLFGLAVTVLAYAALTYSGWVAKPSARIAAVLLLVIFVLLGRKSFDASLWADGLTRYRSVVILLFGMGLLQRVCRNLDIGGPVRHILARASPASIGLIVMAVAAVLALPLSLATVAVMTGLLASVITPAKDAACLSMRMVCLSMYLLPTTVASAAVNSSIAGLNGVDVLLYGSPLVVIGVLLNLRIKPRLLEASPTAVDTRHLRHFGAAFMTLFGLSLLAGLGVPEAVGVCGLGLFILDARRRSVMPRPMLREAAESATGSSAEVLLMFACGLLAQTLVSIDARDSPLLMGVQAIWALPGLAYAIVLLVLPLISIFGIHPLILFNLIFPVVDNSILGVPAAQYIAWVSMFVCAQLLSPVSISAILAAGALRVSPAETSYKLHHKFAAVLALVVFAYLYLSDGGRLMALGSTAT